MEKIIEERILERLQLGSAVYYNGHIVKSGKYKHLVDDEVEFQKTCVGWYQLVNHLEN